MGTTLSLLEKALDIRAYYHKILASNIANAETPGYKEKTIDLRAEIEKPGNDVRNIDVREIEEPEGANAIDRNTVNMEDQIVKLTENNMMFDAVVRLVSKKFSMIKYAINEGR
jgi:flagellar basal-body rod protein FlgB